MMKVRCPICNTVMQGQGPTEWPDFPFCSARCRLIDLGRWLGEAYRVVPDASDDDSGHEDANDPP